jgi:hypothetical protein
MLLKRLRKKFNLIWKKNWTEMLPASHERSK